MSFSANPHLTSRRRIVEDQPVLTLQEISSLYPEKHVTVVHGRSRLLLTADQVPVGAPLPPKAAGGEGRHAAYAYPLIPERVAASLMTQLRARGVEVILDDRVAFPDSDARSSTSTANSDVAGKDGEAGDDGEAGTKAGATKAWAGSDGLLSCPQIVMLTSGRTVEVDYVFAGSGNVPNSYLVASADPSALVEGYVAVDDRFRVISSTSELEECYALGDVANTGGRKTAGQATVEAKCLAGILAAQLKAEAKGKDGREVGKAYAVSSLNSTIIPLGHSTGVPGDGIGAGTMQLGWLGTWRAPKWMIRWFAKDYFVILHFVARFKGEVKVNDL